MVELKRSEGRRLESKRAGGAQERGLSPAGFAADHDPVVEAASGGLKAHATLLSRGHAIRDNAYPELGSRNSDAGVLVQAEGLVGALEEGVQLVEGIEAVLDGMGMGGGGVVLDYLLPWGLGVRADAASGFLREVLNLVEGALADADGGLGDEWFEIIEADREGARGVHIELCHAGDAVYHVLMRADRDHRAEGDLVDATGEGAAPHGEAAIGGRGTGSGIRVLGG